MEQIILNVERRTQKAKRLRENGFIPGVIYGNGSREASSVKFEEKALKKILAAHGSSVKLWIKQGDNKKFGFIKEIQRHPVTNKIIHLDVELVSKDHEVKLQIPIIFKGESELLSRGLLLQIHKSEVNVLGKIDLMPEFITVDASDKNSGDIITFQEFNLDKQIKLHDKINEVYGTITKLPEKPEEESEEMDKEN